MAHEIENMMYVGERPWHHLGVKLDSAPADIATALQLAGLDWTVRLEQLQLADGRPAPRFATVRNSDNSILGTVGEDYHVLQNAQAFAPLERFLASGLATVETGGSLRDGARVWMLLRIAREDSVILGDDAVRKYLLAAAGHDGSLAFHLGITATRVVCQNTLSVAIGAGSSMIRIRHTKGIGDGGGGGCSCHRHGRQEDRGRCRGVARAVPPEDHFRRVDCIHQRCVSRVPQRHRESQRRGDG